MSQEQMDLWDLEVVYKNNGQWIEVSEWHSWLFFPGVDTERHKMEEPGRKKPVMKTFTSCYTNILKGDPEC